MEYHTLSMLYRPPSVKEFKAHIRKLKIQTRMDVLYILHRESNRDSQRKSNPEQHRDKTYYIK